MTRSGARGEGGAGSVLSVAIIGAVLCLVSLLLPLQFAFARKQQAAGAADAAALAAADARSGAVSGVPCVVAAQVAAANGARLDACELDGLVATVHVSTSILGFEVVAAATAGPPELGAD